MPAHPISTPKLTSSRANPSLGGIGVSGFFLVTGLLLLAAALLRVNGAALAEDWRYLTSDQAGGKHYAKPLKTADKEGHHRYWALRSPEGEGVVEYTMEFDCGRSRYRYVENAGEKGAGRVASDLPEGGEWISLTPGVIGTVVLELACLGTNRTPERGFNSSEGPPLKDLGVDYAQVTAKSGRLRASGSEKADVIRNVRRGDVLAFLADEDGRGDWLNVIDVASGKEGWIHRSVVRLSWTQRRNPTITMQGRPTGRDTGPEVTLKNDSGKILTLRVGDASFIVAPKSDKSVEIDAGRRKYHASAPGVIPAFGEQDFERGQAYTWTFWIETSYSRR